MDAPKSRNTSGSSSRKKRSTTNLSDLRLAPLTSQYTEPAKDRSHTKSPREDSHDGSFARHHPSYLQGRSAPTTPGILSRSSSRRNLDGGLSRRGSFYDNDVVEDTTYAYANAGVLDEAGDIVRRDIGQIPKAKSEAALLVKRSKHSGTRAQLRMRGQYDRAQRLTGGSITPRTKVRRRKEEDDWFTRTGATANAMLQESKGQSWLTSRQSANALTHLQDTTDEEDEGYEEMAAISSRPRVGGDGLSPTSTRASRWGSRYGSRTASRRTSRRGSFTAGSRTPLALGGQDGAADDLVENVSSAIGPDFVDEEEESETQNEAVVAGFAENHSFGLGGIVDRLMNFNLFKVDEKEESTEDEVEHLSETEEEAKRRMAAEKKRKRQEKDKLINRSASEIGEDGVVLGEGVWSDAAWLLSVASKVMF